MKSGCTGNLMPKSNEHRSEGMFLDQLTSWMESHYRGGYGWNLPIPTTDMTNTLPTRSCQVWRQAVGMCQIRTTRIRRISIRTCPLKVPQTNRDGQERFHSTGVYRPAFHCGADGTACIVILQWMKPPPIKAT